MKQKRKQQQKFVEYDFVFNFELTIRQQEHNKLCERDCWKVWILGRESSITFLC